MTTKWLDRRIAHAGPYLALCLSEDEFLAAVKRLRIREYGDWIRTPQADATMHRWTNVLRAGMVCIVCLREWQGRDPVEVAGLLIHEAVHIWQGYAEYIGEHSPGSEQEAYAIQAISQELLAEFARRVA